MFECTFKPKTHGKDFILKQKSERLRSKISRSFSPQKIKISEKFDLSVMKHARMRIERDDETDNQLIGQVSPKNFPPSNGKNEKKPSISQGKFSNAIILETETENEFYINTNLPVVEKENNDIFTLNVSNSPALHQILNKNIDTICPSKEPIAIKEDEESKIFSIPAAKR